MSLTIASLCNVQSFSRLPVLSPGLPALAR
jgi:hypothetical protein